MDIKDIIKGLSEFLEQYDSQTYLGSFRETERSSLLKITEGKMTRANALWKMAEYVVATLGDKDSSMPPDDYIEGWKKLAKNANNQYLLLQESSSSWGMYDAQGERLGGDDYILEHFAKKKKEKDNSINLDMPKGKSNNLDMPEGKSNQPLQQIFYGAPGTGKSYYVNEVCKKHLHHRITFHPDTDYAAFVGCYKPKSHKKNMLAGNNLNETQLLSSFFDSIDKKKYPNATKARYLYEALIHTKDIRDLGLDANAVAGKLTDKGFSGCPYTAEATCMFNIYDWLLNDGFIVENKISYEFVPQTFLKAYLDAWEKQDSRISVYLIIEEINRGNCAQIFGDLFQLLDRDENGFSQYEVDADTDMQEFIASKGLSLSNIHNSNGDDISNDVASGKLLKLPNNLNILATMNTSDQSLFPIDSAFKRRWDWRYIKISNGYQKDDKGEYKKDSKGKKIPLEWKLETNDNQDWWEFLKKINEIIASMTSSADKQLGYFFCKADDKGVIKAETFVSKVIFYLWNDVFKDYGFEDASLFTFIAEVDGKEETRELTFPDFYEEDGEKVNIQRVEEFVKNVMNWQKKHEENN